MRLLRWWPRRAPDTPVGDGDAIADGSGPKPPRRLFLDDDPQRALIFLAEYPDAVWVQTAADCVARLAEPWDEVHLDHDLGGEHFVDSAREDCGMEVVRWLCREPRRHLRRARFHVHTHNPLAAMQMGMQLLAGGFSVEVRPFGEPPPPLPEEDLPPRTRLESLARWLRRRFRRPDPLGLGPEGGGDPDARLDLSWTRPGGAPVAGAEPPPPPPKLDLSWFAPGPPPSPPTPSDPPPDPGSPR